MRAANEIFGDYAFRKRNLHDDYKNPINKALLEIWGVNLARCSSSQIETLIHSRKQLNDSFIELLHTDWQFDTSISTSTGSPQRVKKRFQSIEHLIQKHIPC